MPDIELILASGSPRRSELLKSMGVAFQVYVSSIDESRLTEEAPRDYVTRLACSKARASKNVLERDSLAILAADTIAVQDNTVFGKPEDFIQAQSMWSSLSGSKHQVMTAVSLLVRDKLMVKLAVTDVEFSNISSEQMEAYWASGEPQDKAGGYAIQGLASAWVKQIHGSYSNVVGLPLHEVNQLLKSINRQWL